MFYHDDFSDRSSGWPNRATAKYVKGGYQLSDENVAATNGPVFRDLRASVAVTVTAKVGEVSIFNPIPGGNMTVILESGVKT
jgi:hypothetical protein